MPRGFKARKMRERTKMWEEGKMPSMWNAMAVPQGQAQMPMQSRGHDRSSPTPPQTTAAPAVQESAELFSSCLQSHLKPALLLQALESLYEDRLRPLEDLVLRRLHEQNDVTFTSAELQREATWMPEVRLVIKETEIAGAVPDPTATTKGSRRGKTRNLRKAESSHRKDNTWYYLKTDPPGFHGFVDPSLLVDPYPLELWEELQTLLCSGTELWDPSSGVRASSRYSLASFMWKSIPALHTYTLGEVCHIVQLAVRVHHLLGYRGGLIVPFDDSQDAEKLQRAEVLEAYGLEEGQTDAEQSWEDFRRRLGELLQLNISKRFDSGLPMSALKAIYRSRYGVTLSETALGHTKLSTLLQDPRLDGLCRVERMGSEGIIVREQSGTWLEHSKQWYQAKQAGKLGHGTSYAWSLEQSAREIDQKLQGPPAEMVLQ